MKNRSEQIDGIMSAYIEDLKELVAIPSVISDSEDKAPFGSAIGKALDKTLEIAKKLGFQTYKDPDGYYGYADIGSGEPMIGILGHVDVVPSGDLSNWENPPFEPVLKEGKLYGRGMQDDKGPVLASLYALKLIEEQVGIKGKTFRVILGTDEETLWRGIARYKEKEVMPDFGFSPDSQFPLIYAEKGLLQFNLVGPSEKNMAIDCGDSFNAVPSEAFYKGTKVEELEKALEKRDFSFEKKEGGISVKGKSAHAAATEKGINAICRLATALYDIDIKTPSIAFMAEMVGEDPYAQKVFGHVEDEPSGKLKHNIGKWKIDEKEETLCIDVRIPISAKKEEVVKSIEKAANAYGLTYKEHDFLRSIYVAKDTNLVKTLMKAYQKVTKDTKSEPQSSGGATYARAMDNCVAFGAVLPGKPKTEHQPNECIEIDDIKVAIDVYMEACLSFLEE